MDVPHPDEVKVERRGDYLVVHTADTAKMRRLAGGTWVAELRKLCQRSCTNRLTNRSAVEIQGRLVHLAAELPTNHKKAAREVRDVNKRTGAFLRRQLRNVKRRIARGERARSPGGFGRPVGVAMARMHSRT